jgi:hypothetical protein
MFFLYVSRKGIYFIKPANKLFHSFFLSYIFFIYISNIFPFSISPLKFPSPLPLLPNTPTVFIVSLIFGYVLASFSLNSTKSLSSLFLPWPSYHWVDCCSPSMYMWVFYYLYYYWKSALVRGDFIGCMGLYKYFYICWSLFCVPLYGQFWRRHHEVLRRRNTYPFGLG